MLAHFCRLVGKRFVMLPLMVLWVQAGQGADQPPEAEPELEPVVFTLDPLPDLGVSPFSCLFPVVRTNRDDIFIVGDYGPAMGPLEAGAPRMRFAFRLPAVRGEKARGAVGLHWLKDEKPGACELKGPLPAGEECVRAVAEAGCMVEIIDVDEDRWPGLKRFLWQLTETPLVATPMIAIHAEGAMIVIASPVDDPLVFFMATPQGALRKWLVKLHRWALAHSARKAPLEAPINLHVVMP